MSEINLQILEIQLVKGADGRRMDRQMGDYPTSSPGGFGPGELKYFPYTAFYLELCNE